MTSFGIVTENEELGGHTTDLIGRAVGWVPLSTYNADSKFEAGKVDTVMRTRAYGVDEDGKVEDLGIRLVFWAGVQNAIKQQTVANDMALGILQQVPQAANPDRTVYVLGTPSAADIARFERAFNGTSETVTPDAVDEAPF
jgi:hypothetical protein